MDFLFSTSALADKLSSSLREASEDVDEIPKDQFAISPDEEIVQYLAASRRIVPLLLHEDHAVMDQQEVLVDPLLPMTWATTRLGATSGSVHGTAISVKIPFSGQFSLWRFRTDPYTTTYPRGVVHRGNDDTSGTLEIRIAHPHTASADAFKIDYEENLKIIRQYLSWGRAQIQAFNASLETELRRAVSARRDRLNKHNNLTQILEIPLQSRRGVPSLNRITLERRPPPLLPVPPRSAAPAEAGITDAAYEQVLNVIRHEGRTFETTPKTYAKHDEEELRNIMLAHLNGHFLGGATGETFRRSGKTDICIEYEDRSAFVAECKIWRGAAQLSGAVEQLLSYLTWRDSKAALILFNLNVSKFTELLDKMRGVMKNHRLTINTTDCGDPSELRLQMRGAQDEDRRVTVHVFLFNLQT